MAKQFFVVKLDEMSLENRAKPSDSDIPNLAAQPRIFVYRRGFFGGIKEVAMSSTIDLAAVNLFEGAIRGSDKFGISYEPSIQSYVTIMNVGDQPSFIHPKMYRVSKVDKKEQEEFDERILVALGRYKRGGSSF